MTTQQVLEAIRSAMSEHRGVERELLEELCAEAEGWSMRLYEMNRDSRG